MSVSDLRAAARTRFASSIASAPDRFSAPVCAARIVPATSSAIVFSLWYSIAMRRVFCRALYMAAIADIITASASRAAVASSGPASGRPVSALAGRAPRQGSSREEPGLPGAGYLPYPSLPGAARNGLARLLARGLAVIRVVGLGGNRSQYGLRVLLCPRLGRTWPGRAGQGGVVHSVNRMVVKAQAS